jgi:hypothetical protein
MIGHQHPTDKQEFQLLPHLLDPLHKTAAKMFGEEKGRPPIGAGGDELQLSRAVSALVKRHPAGEYTLGKSLPQDAPFGRSQTSQIRGLRQPAKGPIVNSPSMKGASLKGVIIQKVMPITSTLSEYEFLSNFDEIDSGIQVVKASVTLALTSKKFEAR